MDTQKNTENTETKYCQYSKHTQKIMLIIEKHLTDNFQSIKPNWYLLLDCLAQNIEIFNMAKKSIIENGLLIENRFGGLEKNPLIKVQIDSEIQILKIVQELYLSPKSAKALITPEDENEKDLNYIKSLLS